MELDKEEQNACIISALKELEIPQRKTATPATLIKITKKAIHLGHFVLAIIVLRVLDAQIHLKLTMILSGRD